MRSFLRKFAFAWPCRYVVTSLVWSRPRGMNIPYSSEFLVVGFRPRHAIFQTHFQTESYRLNLSAYYAALVFSMKTISNFRPKLLQNLPYLLLYKSTPQITRQISACNFFFQPSPMEILCSSILTQSKFLPGVGLQNSLLASGLNSPWETYKIGLACQWLIKFCFKDRMLSLVIILCKQQKKRDLWWESAVATKGVT